MEQPLDRARLQLQVANVLAMLRGMRSLMTTADPDAEEALPVMLNEVIERAENLYRALDSALPPQVHAALYGARP